MSRNVIKQNTANTGKLKDQYANKYENIIQDLTPLLLHMEKSIEAALRGHAAAEDPDGINYNSSMSFGLVCFDNLAHRVRSEFSSYALANGDPFEIAHGKGLAVLCRHDRGIVKVYIQKVQEQDRIPRGGKLCKQDAMEHLYLSEEIRERMEPSFSEKGALLLDYDVTPEKGQGKICLSLLASQGDSYVSFLIHEYESAVVALPEGIVEPEVIAAPEVRLAQNN